MSLLLLSWYRNIKSSAAIATFHRLDITYGIERSQRSRDAISKAYRAWDWLIRLQIVPVHSELINFLLGIVQLTHLLTEILEQPRIFYSHRYPQ